ncbi:MAG: hypothetical protein V5A57_01365 [Candidatus Paceibacterota bacterium]
MNKGLTIMELLLVIALLILGGILIKFRLGQVERNNEIEETQTDLKEIEESIEELYDETGMDPGHISREPCVRHVELLLEDCSAGLKCTDGAFSEWDGPYLKEIPEDSWGGSYYFDADYLCQKETTGCEDVPNTTKVRAILSGGPDRSYKTTQDNIIKIICE